MSQEPISHEHGQNMLIFAVLMVVLVALAGLVIDGGFALAKRRQAQNAADAGALAGANALCAGDTNLAYSNANEYAIDKNGAASADISMSTEEITVTTFIPHATFLARVFGTNVITTTATASAGCCTPCIGTVLPTAWNCQPPAQGGEVITDTCTVQTGTLADGGPIYLIMDSQNLTQDFYCQDPITHLPADALDCDTDNDGINEIFAGGNRSWLDLSGGGGGASELIDWVHNGYEGVRPHTWYGGQAGVENSVFQAVGDIVGRVVLLPVFNAFCDGLPETNCANLYHPNITDTVSSDITVPSGGTSQMYFHIITYSAFKITCVDAPGVQQACAPGYTDEGRQAAEAANPDINWNSIKTIEGFFIEATDPDLSGCCNGPDLGAHTVYLKP